MFQRRVTNLGSVVSTGCIALPLVLSIYHSSIDHCAGVILRNMGVEYYGGQNSTRNRALWIVRIVTCAVRRAMDHIARSRPRAIYPCERLGESLMFEVFEAFSRGYGRLLSRGNVRA